MQLEILKKEEKRMNLISLIDAIVLAMPVSSALIRFFERFIGSYAKYLYLMVLSIFGAMERVEEISKTSVVTTEGIGAATEQQVAGLENIVKSMKNVQNGMEKLSQVLQNEK